MNASICLEHRNIISIIYLVRSKSGLLTAWRKFNRIYSLLDNANHLLCNFQYYIFKLTPTELYREKSKKKNIVLKYILLETKKEIVQFGSKTVFSEDPSEKLKRKKELNMNKIKQIFAHKAILWSCYRQDDLSLHVSDVVPPKSNPLG